MAAGADDSAALGRPVAAPGRPTPSFVLHVQQENLKRVATSQEWVYAYETLLEAEAGRSGLNGAEETRLGKHETAASVRE